MGFRSASVRAATGAVTGTNPGAWRYAQPRAMQMPFVGFAANRNNVPKFNRPWLKPWAASLRNANLVAALGAYALEELFDDLSRGIQVANYKWPMNYAHVVTDVCGYGSNYPPSGTVLVPGMRNVLPCIYGSNRQPAPLYTGLRTSWYENLHSPTRHSVPLIGSYVRGKHYQVSSPAFAPARGMVAPMQLNGPLSIPAVGVYPELLPPMMPVILTPVAPRYADVPRLPIDRDAVPGYRREVGPAPSPGAKPSPEPVSPPAPVNPPTPRPGIVPRPRPGYEPAWGVAVRASNPRIGRGVGFVKREPPPRGTKEKKFGTTPLLLNVLSRALDATEVADMVDNFFRALPYDKQRELFRRTGGTPSYSEKAWHVYQHFSELDGSELILNILTNEIEDQIIGRVNRRIRDGRTYGAKRRGRVRRMPTIFRP